MFARLKHINEKNVLRFDRYTILSLLLLCAIGIKVSWNLSKYMDVMFWDEALYMERGLAMFAIIPKTWGPAYSLWYKLVSFFVHENVSLYYFNFKLTSLLVSILLYLVMLSMGTQRILAFIFAMFFMSSYLNLPVWPHISHFVIIVILSGILIAKFHQSLLEKLLIWSAAFLMATYARPEMFFPFLLVYGVAVIIFIIRIKQLHKREIIYAASLTITVFLVSSKIGTPLNSGDTQRGIKVFLQHYAWRYSEEHHLKNVFWLEFMDIDKTQFGNKVYSTHFSELLSAYPDKIGHHFSLNFKEYLLQTGKLLVNFFVPIFTEKPHWLALMIALFMLIIYFSLNRKTSSFSHRIVSLLRMNLWSLLMLLLMLLSSVVVCIYAYPREHYLLLQVPFLLVSISLLISAVSIERQDTYSKYIVLGVVWFFVTPESEDFRYFSLPDVNGKLPNQKAISLIKKEFTQKDSIRIFDVEGYVRTMLPANFTDYNSAFFADTTILPSNHILQNKIDIVYVSSTFRLFNRITRDSIMTDMLKHPETYGYLSRKSAENINLLIRKR